jgi:hypothetical protein
MRQFTLSAAGIVLAALLSSASAMAQAYNTDLIGWNRGGAYIAIPQAAPRCASRAQRASSMARCS